ncbi:MAG: hypothetical protein Q9223_007015, partial [Gallowayella weberi]
DEYGSYTIPDITTLLKEALAESKYGAHMIAKHMQRSKPLIREDTAQALEYGIRLSEDEDEMESSWIQVEKPLKAGKSDGLRGK